MVELLALPKIRQRPRICHDMRTSQQEKPQIGNACPQPRKCSLEVDPSVAKADIQQYQGDQLNTYLKDHRLVYEGDPSDMPKSCSQTPSSPGFFQYVHNFAVNGGVFNDVGGDQYVTNNYITLIDQLKPWLKLMVIPLYRSLGAGLL